MIGSMKASPASKQIGIPNSVSRVRSESAGQSLPNSPLNSFTERYGDKLNISSPPRRFADPASLPSHTTGVESPISGGRVTGFSVKNAPGDQGIPISTPKPTQRGLLGKAFDNARRADSSPGYDSSAGLQVFIIHSIPCLHTPTFTICWSYFNCAGSLGCKRPVGQCMVYRFRSECSHPCQLSGWSTRSVHNSSAVD